MAAGDTERVVLVTGASRGIGRAIARAFAVEPDTRVVGTGRDKARLRTLEAELREFNPESYAVPVDLTFPDACTELVSGVVTRCGRLDVLVNNAGIAATVRVEGLELDAWRRLMAINVEAPVLLTREALGVMRRQEVGRIINVASDAALRGIAGMSAYCASKHALLGFGRAVNQELRGTPVRVTTLCPGGVTTQILGPGNPDAMAPEDVAQAAVMAANAGERAYVAEVLLLPARLG